MVYELIILIRHYPLHNFVSTGLCWFLIPFLVIGNAGYVRESLPEWLRLNNRLFILFRVILFLICFFIPLRMRMLLRQDGGSGKRKESWSESVLEPPRLQRSNWQSVPKMKEKRSWHCCRIPENGISQPRCSICSNRFMNKKSGSMSIVGVELVETVKE